MKRCVFVGPTLSGEALSNEIDVYPPAMLGSVFRAVEAGYRRIGVVDGYFGNTPAVWHKEILHALAQGAQVVGAGSTGALRAAELWQFGMLGIGTVFRHYRRGVLRDDDEVCVVHATEEFGYRALSEPMINIRYTLRRMRHLGYIDAAVEAKLAIAMKARHFAYRTRKRLAEALTDLMGSGSAAQSYEAFRHNYVDVKRRDALALIEVLNRKHDLLRPQLDWEFPETANWLRQFRVDIADVPALGSPGPLY